jgi:tetratricopeptide (TPR) repeat protein
MRMVDAARAVNGYHGRVGWGYRYAMRSRLASATWLASADRLAAAFFAIFAASGALSEAAGASAWLVITLAAVGLAGAVVGLVLKALHEAAKGAELAAALWARPPLRACDVEIEAYSLGVDWEAQEALDALGGDLEHAPYLERDLDKRLHHELSRAAARPEATLIVVSGRSKTGKSRTLLEAVAVTLPDAWLWVPRDPSALAKAAGAGAPRKSGADACVIWLDDLEPWAKPRDQGLNSQTLTALGGWGQPVLVLATEGGKGVDLAGAQGARFDEITSDLLARARRCWLEAELTESEAVHPRERFGYEVAGRIEREGIGEFMIAAPRLIARLEHDRECPEGQAIVRAAIDCQRAGLLRPLPGAWLRELFGDYLPGPSGPEDFIRGLKWATRPLYARTALLTRWDADEAEAYVAYDYIVDYVQSRGREILPRVWDRVIDEYANELELTRIAAIAYHAGRRERAERAARRADEHGHAGAGVVLGDLLREGGDLGGATAAYRRADERGDARGAVSLGDLLREAGDLKGATAAYRRADERGDAAGAVSLGDLLRQRDDLEGASAAYRRARERAKAAGETEAAAAALERAGRVAETIQLRFPWDTNSPPFPGLLAFDASQAGVFCGRGQEIEQLLELLTSSHRRYAGRLLAIVGPAGIGKSSLVRAGLVPRLRLARNGWLVVPTIMPGNRPLWHLAHALTVAFGASPTPKSHEEVAQALEAGVDGLIGISEKLSHSQADHDLRAVLVVVDQAEQLVTVASAQECEQFLGLLHAATREAGPLWVLLTLRSEFLSALLQRVGGRQLIDEQMAVGPLDRARMRTIIERPAGRAGVGFAPGLVERIVEDAGSGEALPLLASTLRELYELGHSRGDGIVRTEDYEQLGGIRAQARTADLLYQELHNRGLGDIVLPTLTRLVTLGPDGQPSRRALRLQSFEGREARVLEAFVEARLLVISRRGDRDAAVEIAHEALFRYWPPLVQALELHREELWLRAELRHAADDWECAGRADGYLLSGASLRAAQRLTESRTLWVEEFSSLERDFLVASTRRQAARRRLRLAVAAGLTALFALAVLVVIALVA